MFTANREPDVYLTPAQVAASMQVSVDTVMRLLRSRRLIGRKIGRQWRISTSDLQAYLGSGPVDRHG